MDKLGSNVLLHIPRFAQFFFDVQVVMEPSKSYLSEIRKWSSFKRVKRISGIVGITELREYCEFLLEEEYVSVGVYLAAAVFHESEVENLAESVHFYPRLLRLKRAVKRELVKKGLDPKKAPPFTWAQINSLPAFERYLVLVVIHLCVRPSAVVAIKRSDVRGVFEGRKLVGAEVTLRRDKSLFYRTIPCWCQCPGACVIHDGPIAEVFPIESVVLAKIAKKLGGTLYSYRRTAAIAARFWYDDPCYLEAVKRVFGWGINSTQLLNYSVDLHLHTKVHFPRFRHFEKDAAANDDGEGDADEWGTGEEDGGGDEENE